MASYTGNGIATTPENQFKPEEFGPTRLDERHRVVLSGVFDVAVGIPAGSDHAARQFPTFLANYRPGH